ncbi:MAG: ornithine carbamoyltransferase [Anaerolineae bacterium]|nr:ornithine carbamoyltransferase [Ardenticatenia bacterium]MBK8540039.1 ornithine carbamoyltransferase [Ardenticatenia bacterium]HQZ70133.1 ornithine carbamoyltransferase [Anaerolineae bacterium]HRA21175.1 ornithine carbamoyltransferase [Anaerolineae bacterium]
MDSSITVPRHLASLADLSPQETMGLLEVARELKDRWSRERRNLDLLSGRSLAMLFTKPSLRTRVSFELAMQQLGGHALYLSPAEVGLGQRESVADVARVLGRYADLIMARVYAHADVLALAAHAGVPVINGLSDLEHPCQALADLLTVLEVAGPLAGRHLAYVGDGNNVAHALLLGGAQCGMRVSIIHPPGYAPAASVMQSARAFAAQTGGAVLATTELAAADGAHVLYTDVWASMGQEAEAAGRRAVFMPYQLNQALVDRAAPDCLVLHCLPAHRGEEITDQVMDGPNSQVFAQAENRLHAQKALLAWLGGGLSLAGARVG